MRMWTEYPIHGVAAMTLVGCVGSASPQSIDLKGSDSWVLFPALRSTWVITETSARKEDGEDEPRRPVSFGLELELARGSGEDDVHLGPGTRLDWDDEVYLGPGEVEVEADLLLSHLAAQLQIELARRLRAGVLAGVSYSVAEVTTDDGVSRGRDDRDSAGPIVGLELAAGPWHRLRAYVRGSYSVQNYETEISQLEGGVEARLLDHLGVFGAWRSVHYKAPDGGGFENDVKLSFSGPVVGLSVRF